MNYVNCWRPVGNSHEAIYLADGVRWYGHHWYLDILNPCKSWDEQREGCTEWEKMLKDWSLGTLTCRSEQSIRELYPSFQGWQWYECSGVSLTGSGEGTFKFVDLGFMTRMGCGGEPSSGREHGIWGTGRSLRAEAQKRMWMRLVLSYWKEIDQGLVLVSEHMKAMCNFSFLLKY